MKKLLLTAVVAVSICYAGFAQSENPGNLRVLNNFEADFINVSNVQWVSGKNYVKAFFIEDGHNFEAYYNQYGELIATTSHIYIEDLPTFVTTKFDKKYSDYKIDHALKVIIDNNITWFVTAVNDINTVVFKVENGSISVYKKIAKNIGQSLGI